MSVVVFACLFVHAIAEILLPEVEKLLPKVLAVIEASDDTIFFLYLYCDRIFFLILYLNFKSKDQTLWTW